MSAKRTNFVFAVLIICLLSFSVFGAGCSIVKEKLQPATVIEKQLSNLPPEFNILSDVWNVLSQDYVDKGKLDVTKLSRGAVKGMLEALDDPYTVYVAPETYKLELSSFEGKFYGIGAEVGIKDKQLMIIAPRVGSPAEKAGIKAGDKVLKINGEDTSKTTLTEAVLKIRGPEGTTVNLLILHQGESDPVEIKIIRGEIRLESVSTEMRGDIAYIKVNEFLKSTGGDLRAALADVIKKGATGIVLDLRNNPGGLLDAAIDVASQFLARGIVVDVVYSEGKDIPVFVKQGGIATNLQLVVLVNGGSASASEIVAGALQDYGRAKLIGSKTFGKGSVQQIRNLKDGSAVHVTTARWLTPSGRPINGVGLTPDFVLDLEGDALVAWAINYLKGQISASYLTVGV